MIRRLRPSKQRTARSGGNDTSPDKRARRWQVNRGTRYDFIVALLGAAGFAGGYLFVTVGLDGNGQDLVERSEGKFWTYLTGLQAAYWTVIGLPLWYWWLRVLRRSAIARERLAASVFSAASLLLFVLVPVVLIGTTWPTDVYPTTRIASFIGVGLFVALPAVLTIKAIQFIGSEGDPTAGSLLDGQAHLVQEYLQLKSQLRRILLALGGMISFVVVSTGAFRDAINAARPGAMSAHAVLFYGGVFAVGLAFLYIPAHTAVQALGWRLVDCVCSVPPLQDPALDGAIDRRSKIAGFLKLEATASETLERSAVVLAPLITAVISTALGD